MAYTSISNYSLFSTTYRPAIWIDGVGNYVGHCFLSHGPHSAIIYAGNEHLLEYNYISQVGLETSDVGVVYSGRDWTAQGTLIRFNMIAGSAAITEQKLQGIYLDDMASGTAVYGNVFFSIFRGIQMGGGRSNTIGNNVFINCHISIMIDARGNGRQAYHVQPGGTVRERFTVVPVTSDEWISHYPGLAILMEDEFESPKYTQVFRNVLVNTSEILVSRKAIPYVEQVKNAPLTKLTPPPTDLTVDYLTGPFAEAVAIEIPDFEALPWKLLLTQDKHHQ